MTAWFAIAGRSMWPLTAPLEAKVEPLSARSMPVGDLQVGDIIAFVGTRPGAVFMHRVTALAGDRIETRGDTNRQSDPAIAPTAVLGRVVALRWRWLAVEVPCEGAAGAAWRQLGKMWSRIAPAGFAVARRVHATLAQT